jgi:hypothetical protein
MPVFVTAKIGTCWWCGDTANSHEHKFKRADIEREFGRGPYREGQTLVKHSYDEWTTDVTGSKSKVFKFEPTMCAGCNGERSQPFDAAYDQFMDYLSDNEAEVLGSGEVDLRIVFGAEWEAKRLNLARYFAKHICCRLANVAEHRAVPIDTRVIEFLDGGEYPRCLGLAPLLDMSVVEWWRLMRLLEEGPGDYGSFLYLTGIGGVDAPRPATIQNPEAGMLVGWFGVYWRIADDEFVPNQLAGPVMPLIVVDWIFGTDNRLVFASASAAIESGVIDPQGKQFGDLVDGFGFDRSRSMIDSKELFLRPEPSTIGLSRDRSDPGFSISPEVSSIS